MRRILRVGQGKVQQPLRYLQLNKVYFLRAISNFYRPFTPNNLTSLQLGVSQLKMISRMRVWAQACLLAISLGIARYLMGIKSPQRISISKRFYNNLQPDELEITTSSSLLRN